MIKKMSQHCLTLKDLSREQIQHIIKTAIAFKAKENTDDIPLQDSKPLTGKSVAMIFSQPSTRTRISFEVAIHQLGGHPIFMSEQSSQISRGETPEDTARVLSKMVHLAVLRHSDHTFIENVAKFASIPVINALSDLSHPCQVLADMQAFCELRGDIAGKKVAWIGDYNNMHLTYTEAATIMGFELYSAIPEKYIKNRQHGTLYTNIKEAAKNADLVITDTWASMSDKKENEREKDFLNFQVNSEIMALAKKDALFMHCLPVYRGKEVSEKVFSSKQSAVWEACENRVYAQKALMHFLAS